MMMMPTLPTILIDNNTTVVLNDISLSYEGMKEKRPSIKKIKPSQRKSASLYNINIVGEKKIFLYIGEEFYEIFNKLTNQYRGTILVTITKNNENKIEIQVDTNYNK